MYSLFHWMWNSDNYKHFTHSNLNPTLNTYIYKMNINVKTLKFELCFIIFDMIISIKILIVSWLF